MKVSNTADFQRFLVTQAKANGQQPKPRQSNLLMSLLTALEEGAEPWRVGILTWEFALASFNRADVLAKFRAAHLELARVEAIQQRREWLTVAASTRGYVVPITQAEANELWAEYRCRFHDLRKKPDPRRDTFNRDLKAVRLRK